MDHILQSSPGGSYKLVVQPLSQQTWAQAFVKLISVLTWQDLVVAFSLLLASGTLFLYICERSSTVRSALITLAFWLVESAVVLSIRHHLGLSQK